MIEHHYVELPNGPGCGLASVSNSNECWKAAKLLGYTANGMSGSWGHAPYGFFVSPYDGGAYVYFNQQHGQTGRDIYKSICRGMNFF